MMKKEVKMKVQEDKKNSEEKLNAQTEQAVDSETPEISEVDNLKKQVEELNDKLLRILAEFENTEIEPMHRKCLEFREKFCVSKIYGNPEKPVSAEEGF